MGQGVLFGSRSTVKMVHGYQQMHDSARVHVSELVVNEKRRASKHIFSSHNSQEKQLLFDEKQTRRDCCGLPNGGLRSRTGNMVTGLFNAVVLVR
jgi:hypothetical protein